MKRKNLNKGITLIALVVTIVVLLILAAITLNLVLGNNGIISKARDARDKTKQAQVNSELEMNQLLDEMNGNLDDTVQEVSTIYAKLYTDGTLILSSTDYTDSSRTVSEDYGDISKNEFILPYYHDDVSKITGEFWGWIDRKTKKIRLIV